MHGYPSHAERVLPSEAEVLNVNLIRLAQYLKPDIGIVDGTVGLQGNGPGGTDAVPMGAAAASADVFAVDAVMAKAMGFEPMELGPFALRRHLGLRSGRVGADRGAGGAHCRGRPRLQAARDDRAADAVAQRSGGAVFAVGEC